ncbi:MAG: DUF3800 domain-containing protein [Blastocatellia bacterium]
MLVFIDESGDPGLKTDQGSSRFFTIGLVVFEDHDEAQACDDRITLLKRELGWSEDSEFHFKTNSNRVRQAFLEAVAPYNFFYYGIVIDKDPKRLDSDLFKNKLAFYKYACGLVFENAKEKLIDAIVVIDEAGSLLFKNQLSKYLRSKINRETRLIKKIKMRNSEGNNLLQLADYVAGVINRSVSSEKPDAEVFRKIIAHREIYAQVWPK